MAFIERRKDMRKINSVVVVVACALLSITGFASAEGLDQSLRSSNDVVHHASEQSGTLVAAETEKKKTDPAPSPDVEERGIRPGLGGIAPGRGTFTPVPFKCETNFPSGQNVCLCKGTADCFDMGSKDVCKTGTIDCPPGQGHCTCMKKQ
jgi:hypothetical protein